MNIMLTLYCTYTKLQNSLGISPMLGWDLTSRRSKQHLDGLAYFYINISHVKYSNVTNDHQNTNI